MKKIIIFSYTFSEKYAIIYKIYSLSRGEDLALERCSQMQMRQKKCLCRDATYIGVLLLAVEAAFLFSGIFLEAVKTIFSINDTVYLCLYALVYSFGLLVPSVIVSMLFRRRYFPLSPCKRTNALDAFLGILTAIGGCMMANFLSGIVASIFESLGAQRPEMPDFMQPTLPSLLLNLFVFSVLPALLEELVFRGYVLRTLRVYGDWFAVAVSSLMFGLMHGNIEQIPFALIVGFLLGWLYVMSDNIWLPITVHFANNAFANVSEYLSLGINETQVDAYYSVVMLLLLVVGLVCFAVLIARRSALLRRLPRRGELTMGGRISAVAMSPMFILCIVVYILLTLLGS